MGSSMERASLDMMAVIVNDELNKEMKEILENKARWKSRREIYQVVSADLIFFLAGDGPVNLATVGEGNQFSVCEGTLGDSRVCLQGRQVRGN